MQGRTLSAKPSSTESPECTCRMEATHSSALTTGYLTGMLFLSPRTGVLPDLEPGDSLVLHLVCSKGSSCHTWVQASPGSGLPDPQLPKAERMARLRVQTAHGQRRVRSSAGLQALWGLTLWWDRSRAAGRWRVRGVRVRHADGGREQCAEGGLCTLELLETEGPCELGE